MGRRTAIARRGGAHPGRPADCFERAHVLVEHRRRRHVGRHRVDLAPNSPRRRRPPGGQLLADRVPGARRAPRALERARLDVDDDRDVRVQRPLRRANGLEQSEEGSSTDLHVRRVSWRVRARPLRPEARHGGAGVFRSRDRCDDRGHRRDAGERGVLDAAQGRAAARRRLVRDLGRGLRGDRHRVRRCSWRWSRL